MLYRVNGGHEVVLNDWDDVSMDHEVTKGLGKFRHYINNEVLGLATICFHPEDLAVHYREALNIVIEKLDEQPFIEENPQQSNHFNQTLKEYKMRKLVSVQKVLDTLPIESADAIEVVVINGWKVVTRKGEFQKGDLCIYCEIDSLLPIREEFEFLRKSSFKRMGDREGFRLKTIKLRDQVSQGLVLPLDILSNFGIDISSISEEWDLTDALGVVKYEPPIPAELSGMVEGAFPSFLRKTDLERVQNIKPETYSSFISDGIKFYASEKLDGSSATYFVKDGVFGVCSRNWQLAEPEERPYPNTFWKVADKLDLKSKMLKMGRNIALQGELIGEGIQGNRYKLQGHDVRFFNVYDIDARTDLNFQDFISILSDLELIPVPILYTFSLTSTVDGLIEQAEGKSDLCKDVEREGLVIRSVDGKISFKAISNKFLLKSDD